MRARVKGSLGLSLAAGLAKGWEGGDVGNDTKGAIVERREAAKDRGEESMEAKSSSLFFNISVSLATQTATLAALDKGAIHAFYSTGVGARSFTYYEVGRGGHRSGEMLPPTPPPSPYTPLRPSPLLSPLRPSPLLSFRSVGRDFLCP